MEIEICVGSSCHIKGSPAVISLYEELIRKHRLQKKAILKAAFCQNRCTRGIVIRFGDHVVEGVTPENAAAVFVTEVLEGLRR